jgi:acyl-CoA dehydrogenase
MAWDFCNDPAFEPELEWTRQFVRAEIEPLDLVKSQMSRASYKLAAAPLKQQVKERGLWAGHLDPELGGQGLGQVKLALLH